LWASPASATIRAPGRTWRPRVELATTKRKGVLDRMTSNRRVWLRRGLLGGLAILGCQQAWRHGKDFVFAEQFAVVEPGKIYRGAWQRPWPMRRLVQQYKVKTVLALAHPSDHPLSVSERELGRELGFRWVHIPIVDERGTGEYEVINAKLEAAAAVLADPANYPVYFHCHHGLNRASMVQIAYRTKYCGWTLEQATDEIRRTFGLIEVNHGPDYRHMELFYADRVLHLRKDAPSAEPAPPATTAPPVTAQSAEDRARR
jgi:protein-tyrosine phosphatase